MSVLLKFNKLNMPTSHYFFIISVCLSILSSCDKTTTDIAVNPLQDLNGRIHTPQNLEKNWLIINYWASWCAPCREEVPELNKLATRHPHWQLLAVSFDELEVSILQREASKLGFTFPVLRGDPSTLLNIERPQVLPTTFIFAPGLELYKILRGPQTAKALEKIIEGSSLE